MPSRPRRRSIRLPGYDYASLGAYFVTVCTRDRLCLLGKVVGDAVVLSEAGHIVRTAWAALPTHFPHVAVDAFVVMPSHVHGIVCIMAALPDRTVGAQHAAPLRLAGASGRGCVAPGSFGAIVRSFKSAATRNARRRGLAFAWQRNYFERVLRDERELQAARRYIAENPLRWHLDHLHPHRRPW